MQPNRSKRARTTERERIGGEGGGERRAEKRDHDGPDTTATPTDKRQINATCRRRVVRTTAATRPRAPVTSANGVCPRTGGRRGQDGVHAGKASAPSSVARRLCPPPPPLPLAHRGPQRGVLPRGAVQTPLGGSGGRGLTISPIQGCVRGGGGECSTFWPLPKPPRREQRPWGGGATWGPVRWYGLVRRATPHQHFVFACRPPHAEEAVGGGCGNLARPARLDGRAIRLMPRGNHSVALVRFA